MNAPLLAADLERSLFCLWRATGDERVRTRIVRPLLGLVEATARRYQSRGVPFEDLVAAGHVGLAEAVHRFDPARGCRLSTFATPYITGAIAAELKQHQSLVSSGRPVRGAIIEDDEFDDAIAEQIDPDESAIVAETAARVRAALAELDDQELAVMQLKLADDSISMCEVGRRLGISHEWARQIHERAAAKLRESLRSYYQEISL